MILSLFPSLPFPPLVEYGKGDVTLCVTLIPITTSDVILALNNVRGWIKNKRAKRNAKRALGT